MVKPEVFRPSPHKVRYLVVGGYAVAMHGHPRYTGDLDVFVDATTAL